jgi:hypothetical protein
VVRESRPDVFDDVISSVNKVYIRVEVHRLVSDTGNIEIRELSLNPLSDVTQIAFVHPEPSNDFITGFHQELVKMRDLYDVSEDTRGVSSLRL